MEVLEGEALCVGDLVCLYSEDVHGYVHSFQSSSIHNALAVALRQDRDIPQLASCQAIAFALSVANRYKLNKAYQKLKTKSDGNPDDVALKTRCSQAEIGADAEHEDNLSEQKRQLGKKLVYGQVIQLKHLLTGKFIHVSTTQTSCTESSNIQVALHKTNSKHAQFRLMPRYKVKSEGDLARLPWEEIVKLNKGSIFIITETQFAIQGQVQVGDQVILESMKSPGQYLHVSKALFGKNYVYSLSHELNLSVGQSGFTIYRRYKPEQHNTNMLRAGVPLRLFHKEIEAYLCAEGLFDDEVTENVHLRMRPMDQNNNLNMFPSTSSIVYWELELETSPISGSVIRWGQQCRFRHLTTRHYLCVDASQNVGLTLDHRDPNAVFRLHPVVKQSDQIEFETYCRIEHVVTSTWFNALSDEYKRKQTSSQGAADMSMAALQWTQAPLKQIGTSKEMQYDDAFTLQRVSDEQIENFFYVAGMVPFLQKLIADKKGGMVLKAKQTHEIVQALEELNNFMIVNDVPNKERQKLLRNLRIVELLVKLLQIPYRGTNDQHHMIRLLVKCYDVLYTYLMGHSRKNELYIAKHIDFFNSQISYQGDIGLNAAKMVMQLVKDNRKIVDRITHKHIDTYIDLLRQNKNYCYLDLLSVLCICDGVSISDNQTYITEAWLMQEQKNCVYHTELGEKISKTPGVVFVSTDNQRHWISLHEFIRDVRKGAVSESDNELLFSRDQNADDEYLFLTHQLDLFGNLCAGRNSFAIQVITEDLCYLTIEEAFLCLKDDVLPDELRSIYCSLIIDMAVDVGDSTSVVDTINLTFVYDHINDIEHMTARPTIDNDSRKGAELLDYIAQLREWLSLFLAANMDMTASLIGHNMLLEQVLRLVYCLVKFGHYGNIDDMKQLLDPLLSLLNGRNDKPYPHVQRVPSLQSVNDHYSTKLRFKQSPETKAIVDAKCQAMLVLDLFCNFQFNTRLEGFMELFKVTYAKAHHSTEFVPELGTLLNVNYDIAKQAGTNKVALKRLSELFQEADYFGTFPLTDILLDVSDYDYDAMVVKSMALLNRQYSSRASLFTYAVQAQILITDESERVHDELRQVLPQLRRMTASKMSDEQTTAMSEILDTLIAFCSLANDREERHAMNQSILYNYRILGTVFDILSQEVDVKLKAQYESTLVIFRQCFMLFKVMARGNGLVQQRLFDRLDLILSIPGTEPEMAAALIEVFTGNKETCLKILPRQVQKIMSLAATHTKAVPQFLDLLNSIVKLEEFNLPLKRNQTYVMKYFMQYRAEVAYVIDQPKEQIKKLLDGPMCPDLRYLISVVDLLATCAEGENRFIESICQTIFSVDELMETLNDADMSLDRKRPYVRFLLWVYLNTASGLLESGAGDLAHSSDIWNYMNSLVEVLRSLTAYASAETDTVKQLLKKALSNVSEGHTDTWSGLHYILDCVMPFLQVFYHKCYQANHMEFSQEADHTDTLAKALVEFSRQVGPLVSNATHVKTLVGCMNVILTVSTLPIGVMQEFEQKFGSGSKVYDIRGDARKMYDEYYAQEQELNEQLNTFAANFSVVYGGANTTRAQIGYSSDKGLDHALVAGDLTQILAEVTDYTELGGDEELPLGAEFQEHIQCFVAPQAKTVEEQYRQAGKLIKQLAISTSMAWQVEKDRLDQEALDIKSLQLLRALIHNEIVKLPENWQPGVSSHVQLRRVEYVQNALNQFEAVVHVLPHLAMNSDSLVRESLAFIVAMLFGGNRLVQKNCSSFFLGTREEKFFFAIKNRMLMTIMATKEKRSLRANHQQKVEEAIEQAKTLRKAMKAGDMATQVITTGSLNTDPYNNASISKNNKKSNSLNSRNGAQSMFSSHHSLGSRFALNKSRPGLPQFALNAPNGSAGEKPKGFGLFRGSSGRSRVAPTKEKAVTVMDLNSKDLVQLVEQSMEEDEMDYHDDGYIELVLRMMGSMCDGQNTVLQDYLREQPDNIKSVNLIAETAQFLSLIYGSVNNQNITLITELFTTLVEFSLGNDQNKLVVFDCKVVDYINCILRSGHFSKCSDEEILVLKQSIATLIVAMIEEDFTIGSLGPKEIGETIDAETIWHIAEECYNDVNECDETDGVSSDLVKETEKLGFQFYHILCRLRQLDTTNHIPLDKLLKTSEDREVWDHYDDGTLSIEIVKDDNIQKMHFRCRDKSVLREDVKEKFKYEVDRSSPSNKLRELIGWSKDITLDINYTRRVMKNPLARCFVRYWWHFNMGMIFMSFVFFVLTMVTWRQPPDANSHVPVFEPANVVRICNWVFGGIHNAFTGCVLISYFIVNHPTLPRLQPTRRLYRQLMRSEETENEEQTNNRTSNLEVKFFSFKTFWYLILGICSALGTVFYGYFFAFHLLHIAEFNQLLRRTIRAVTQNGISLLWVFIYGLIIMYIFALCGFAFYRELFDAQTGLYCSTLYECSVTMLHRGFILGILEFLEVPEGKPFMYHLWKAIFDVTFFIIITTIGLNIIFGIIVDTFSELRDNKWQVESDMRNTCFICSRNSYDFEHHGHGFEHHVKEEHNQWAYVFFFIHLDETRPNDLTALELYVNNLLANQNYDFFPVNRAISLQHEEDDSEVRLQKMMSYMTYLVKTHKEEVAAKEKKEELKVQKDWERKYRGEKREPAKK